MNLNLHKCKRKKCIILFNANEKKTLNNNIINNWSRFRTGIFQRYILRCIDITVCSVSIHETYDNTTQY